MKSLRAKTSWRCAMSAALCCVVFASALLSGCSTSSTPARKLADNTRRATTSKTNARSASARTTPAKQTATPIAQANDANSGQLRLVRGVPDPEALARPQITLAEASAAMLDSGDMYGHVLTRTKPGGVHTTPKYPGKAWEAFMAIRVPEGENHLPDGYREEALKATLENESLMRGGGSPAASWSYIGPDGSGGVQPSGRMIELAVHPTDSNTMYAAAASGGIYKTTNGGNTWANVTDAHLPSIGMGSVAIDPFNGNVVYCGLGEGQPGSFYEPYGNGIYRSTDAGATWTMLPNTAGMEYVTDIQVTNSSNRILAASKGRSDGTGAGIWRSDDGGSTWSNLLPSFSFWDIAVNPNDRNNVLITLGFTNNGPNQSYVAIYRSTDGGVNFTETFPGAVWNNTGTVRCELSFSGSNTVYALFAAGDSSLAGILKSTDGGANWTAPMLNGIPGSGDYKPGQMTYNCAIGVPPGSPNTVYMGSNLRMYKSTDGGNNFTWITDWAGNDGLPYVHADHHTMRFVDDSTLLLGCDGGFFKTTNGGASWTELNVGFEALQCYSIDNHPTDPNVYIMGLQDNDKYLRRTDGSWHHYPNAFGDGMEMIIYPNNTTTAMGANYYGGAVRITENGGGTWNFLRTYGGSNNGIPDGERGAWVVPFMLHPNNPNQMFLMVEDLWTATYTPGLLPTWTQLLNFPEGYAPQNIEKMAFAGSNTGTQSMAGYVGRYNSTTEQWIRNFWASNVDGSAASFMTLPLDAWVNAVAGDPNDSETYWIGYSNVYFGLGNRSRVFRTTDRGQSWTNMTANLPQNLPVSAIWIDPNNSNTVVVGTDIGVYRSDNGGTSYTFWNTGLPKVVVSDLAYFPAGRKLRVGTYGRGIYETAIDGPSASATATAIRNGLLGTAPAPGDADYNGNARQEVGDVVGAVNAGRP